MNTSQNPAKHTEKKGSNAEELKTDPPLSEKDEVKAAEQKMAKNAKKSAQTRKSSK